MLSLISALEDISCLTHKICPSWPDANIWLLLQHLHYLYCHCTLYPERHLTAIKNSTSKATSSSPLLQVDAFRPFRPRHCSSVNLLVYLFVHRWARAAPLFTPALLSSPLCWRARISSAWMWRTPAVSVGPYRQTLALLTLALQCILVQSNSEHLEQI